MEGVSPEGEFHEITQPASEVLLMGVVPTGAIHLGNQCASEGILEGVASKGEFHGGALKRAETPNLPQRAETPKIL